MAIIPQTTSPSIIVRKWWVLLAVGIGSFMSALDGSVVNAILPVIRQELSAEVSEIEWVITIYLLVVSGLLLTFGRLGDLRGHKAMYVGGFVIFGSGSALCSLAPTTGALVAARGLQALGAAMIFSNSPAIITKNFPAAQRGQALGLQATMTYLGLMVGPSLGGWLAAHVSWRAVFYINVPIALIALVVGLRFIPRDRPEAVTGRFDRLGAGLFLAGLVALLLGLNQGHAWGWLSPRILALLAGAAALLAGFVWVEGRAPDPMLELGLFRRQTFTVATLAAVLNYIAVYSILFLIPFYLIQGRGLNSAQAGGLLTAQPIVMAVVAPLSGTLSDRVGTRRLAVAGMAVLGAALWLLSRLGPETPLAMVAGGLALAGLGTGLFVSPNNSALMGAAPRERQGIAAGILATARNVGMVLGVGLAGAILTTLLQRATPLALFEAVQLSFIVLAGVAAAGVLVVLAGRD